MIEHLNDILNSDLLERYVLGDVTAEERIKVESLRIEHRQIREELEKLELSIEKLSSENAVTSPPGTRECIIKSIGGQSKQPSATVASGIAAFWLKIAAAFIFGGLLSWLWTHRSLTEANGIINEQAVALETLQDDCDQVTQTYAFLNHTHTLPIILEGTQRSPQSQVVVYWNEQLEQSMLRVVELPLIDDDQTFQLWADVEGEMLSLGVFDASNALLNPVYMEYLTNAESLNITIEPKGGSDHPTVATLTASKVI